MVTNNKHSKKKKHFSLKMMCSILIAALVLEIYLIGELYSNYLDDDTKELLFYCSIIGVCIICILVGISIYSNRKSK